MSALEPLYVERPRNLVIATATARRATTRQPGGETLDLCAIAGPAIARNNGFARGGTGPGQWLALWNNPPHGGASKLASRLNSFADWLKHHDPDVTAA